MQGCNEERKGIQHDTFAIGIPAGKWSPAALHFPKKTDGIPAEQLGFRQKHHHHSPRFVLFHYIY
jgi:hypothetical protein